MDSAFNPKRSRPLSWENRRISYQFWEEKEANRNNENPTAEGKTIDGIIVKCRQVLCQKQQTNRDN